MQLGLGLVSQMCSVYKSLETVHPQTESQLLAKNCIVKLYKFQIRGAAEVNYSTDEIWVGYNWQMGQSSRASCDLIIQ